MFSGAPFSRGVTARTENSGKVVMETSLPTLGLIIVESYLEKVQFQHTAIGY